MGTFVPGMADVRVNVILTCKETKKIKDLELGKVCLYPYIWHSWQERAHFKSDVTLGWLFASAHNGKQTATQE